MATKRTAARLHLLTARQVQTAGEGDHGDRGGLYLRVQGAASSWVFRYTAPSGKRRELGLGRAHRGSIGQAGETLTAARDAAHRARELLRADTDPLTAREQAREAARQADEARKTEKQRERWTLARCTRDYHERVIEPSRTAKHSAQWISSLENHVPPALWNAPVESITAPALLSALLDAKAHERARNLTSGDKVPETLRRIRQRLEAVFEDAVFHGRATYPAAGAGGPQDWPPEVPRGALRPQPQRGGGGGAGRGQPRCGGGDGVRPQKPPIEAARNRKNTLAPYSP